ncbi:hypothetical protein TNCV_2037821 [Trichonephila clavipes]|nr:hypothetical protein TNCV_2037821 [Trichonephila clavipes]
MQYHGVGRHHDQWPHALHVVANGTMTGQRYIDEVLLPHVRLFRGAVGDKFVFMDDNATCHRKLAVQGCLDSEGLFNVSQVAGRNYHPTNKNTLIRALTEEWDKLPQQLLDNVVQTAPAREDCVLLLAACHNGQPDCTLSAAVRLPFFLSMDTRGESETYKKDGTDKDYTTNTQRFNIS